MIETDSRGRVRIKVKVRPGAPRTKIVGVDAERLAMDIAAPPERGKANRELIRFLARTLGVSKDAIRISAGESDRHKTVVIQGIEEKEIRRVLLGQV